MAEHHTRKNYSNVEAVDILHQVANLYISTKIPQDYGTGEEYTSVEVHTLKHIADNPGIMELSDHQLQEMLFRANAAASLETTRKGAIRAMPTQAELEDYLKQLTSF